MLLSIIIPIYNVEQYIGTCFESLFKQDLDSSLYEIIAVNDGTPDNSMKIVEEYAEKYSNIKIVNKENGGVSSARNEGIRRALGDFVIFVDPDDAISENSLLKIHQILVSNRVDILILRSFLMNSFTERYPWERICSSGINMKGVDVFKIGYSRGSVWGGVYRRVFLEEKALRFSDKLTNGEDSLFFNMALMYASNVRFMDLPFYYISVREGSASRDFDMERIFRFSENLKIVHDYLNTHATLTDEQKAILYYVQYSVISSAVNHYVKVGGFNYLLLKDKLLLGKVLPISVVGIHTQRLKIRLLNCSFFLYFFLYLFKSICKR